MKEKAIKKSLDLLRLETYSDIDDLIRLLKDYRIMFHPDKFKSEEAKKEAKLKFTDASDLLEELENTKGAVKPEILIQESIEISRLIETRSIISSQISDIQLLKQENDSLRKIIQDLESRNRTFEKASENEKTAHIKRDIIDIEKTYEVSRNEILGAAAALILTATVAMLTAIDEIADLLRKASPFPSEIINVILFFVSLIIIFMAARRIFKDHEFRSMLREISNMRFIDELNKSEKLEGGFSEIKLLGCIEQKFKSLTYKRLVPNKFKWIIKFFPIRLFFPYPIRTFARKKLGLLEPKSIDLLKDALILYMLERKIIEHESTYKLDRIYRPIDWDL